jgi:anti-anti-sigma regulatory factor
VRLSGSKLVSEKTMLRISESFENYDTLRLRLEGTLLPESYEAFAEIFATQQRAGRKTIIVDLTGITFMNDDSARKIAALQSEQVRVINCSPFIETLLSTLQIHDAASKHERY